MYNQLNYNLEVRRQKSICIDLVGGLGNQLFCYCAGRYLSIKLESSATFIVTNKFNSTMRDGNLLRELRLPGNFVIKLKKHPENSCTLKLARKIHQLTLRKITNQFRKNHYFATEIGYDQNLENVKKPVYIHGYFQSWKYAAESKSIILGSLRENVAISDYARKLMREIEESKGFFVHIRLGDYQNSENSYFGILSPIYYRNVLNNFNLTGRKFFVFSDDIEMASRDYGYVFPEGTTWVDRTKQLSDLETLVLMTRADGGIVANSTFSWWGAFLGPVDSLVVAPSDWYKAKPNPTDLIPLNWQREESVWQS